MACQPLNWLNTLDTKKMKVKIVEVETVTRTLGDLVSGTRSKWVGTMCIEHGLTAIIMIERKSA